MKRRRWLRHGKRKPAAPCPLTARTIGGKISEYDPSKLRITVGGVDHLLRPARTVLSIPDGVLATDLVASGLMTAPPGLKR